MFTVELSEVVWECLVCYHKLSHVGARFYGDEYATGLRGGVCTSWRIMLA